VPRANPESCDFYHFIGAIEAVISAFASLGHERPIQPSFTMELGMMFVASRSPTVDQVTEPQ